MIDMHIHLLPDIDDGAQSLQESVQMLSMLAGMGFDRLVATPHLIEPLPEELHLRVIAALNELASPAAAQGIALAVGYEHVLSPALVPRLRAGEPSTLAGSSAILVELPFIHWPPDTAQNLFKLSEAGYRPVLAHPERYLDAMQSPDLVTDAVALGAVPQITSGSLVGLYGADAQRLARYLVTACLEGDLPFIFSSDAHSAGRRLSSVAGGLDWVRIHLPAGAEIVEWATTAVPMQLVTNVPPQAFRTWLAQARPESTVPGPGAFRAAPAEGQGDSKQGRGLSRLFRRGSH